MTRLEDYLRAVGAVNHRMWAQIEPLERQLRSLEAEYQAAGRRPAVDVVATGVAALLAPKVDAVSSQVNLLYEEWRMSIAAIGPPPSGQKPAGDWTARIPWPKSMPPEVKRYVLRVVGQGGIPLSKRVTVKPGRFPYGGSGLVLEYSKW